MPLNDYISPQHGSQVPFICTATITITLYRMTIRKRVIVVVFLLALPMFTSIWVCQLNCMSEQDITSKSYCVLRVCPLKLHKFDTSTHDYLVPSFSMMYEPMSPKHRMVCKHHFLHLQQTTQLLFVLVPRVIKELVRTQMRTTGCSILCRHKQGIPPVLRPFMHKVFVHGLSWAFMTYQDI